MEFEKCLFPHTNTKDFREISKKSLFMSFSLNGHFNDQTVGRSESAPNRPVHTVDILRRSTLCSRDYIISAAFGIAMEDKGLN